MRRVGVALVVDRVLVGGGPGLLVGWGRCGDVDVRGTGVEVEG